MKFLSILTLLFALLINTASAKGRKRKPRPSQPPVVNTPIEIAEEDKKLDLETVDKVAAELYENLKSNEQIQYAGGEKAETLATLMFELCTKSPAGKNYTFEQLQVYCLIPLPVRVCSSPKLLKGKSLREAFDECDVEYKSGNVKNLYEAVKVTFIDKDPELTSAKLDSIPKSSYNEETPFVVALYDALDIVVEGTSLQKMLEGEAWLSQQLPFTEQQ
jgi:hypothetical protein